jgi:hypothetical protein
LLGTEGGGEGDESDEDYDPAESDQGLVQQCLDIMALHIPAKHFAQHAFNVIGMVMALFTIFSCFHIMTHFLY